MNTPKFTVITVCYNVADSIEETILSVINQTYSNLEYIIIDGASTDGTIDVINKYRDRITYFLSEPDKGIYDAMNKGVKASTGDWINFMNAGDTFYSKSVIADIVPYIEVESKILYGDTVFLYSMGKKVYRPSSSVDMGNGMFFNHQSSFADAVCMKKYLFDGSYKLSADYKFHYTLYKRGMKFQYVPVIIANYDAQNGASSRQYPLLLKEYGQIRGESDSLKWQVLYMCNVFFFYVKSFMKIFVPTRILMKKNRIENI